MSGPFLKQQVKSLAVRPFITGQPTLADQIDTVDRLLFGHQGRPDELALWLQTHVVCGHRRTTRCAQFLTRREECLHVLRLSNKFMFVD